MFGLRYLQTRIRIQIFAGETFETSCNGEIQSRFERESIYQIHARIVRHVVWFMRGSICLGISCTSPLHTSSQYGTRLHQMLQHQNEDIACCDGTHWGSLKSESFQVMMHVRVPANIPCNAKLITFLLIHFRCEICDKTFVASKYLRNHRRRHESERNFICDICGKSFTSKDATKTHIMSVHVKSEPKFKCNICDKG